ncbi:MAG: Flp pilus assembly complex ATPase component TadA [Treponema sp.]|nr:Flp pilus assembly complex ATPase component TadA [Treponema sp.]
MSKFTLSPVFCLHNGAVVLRQDEDSVTIGLLDMSNIVLRCRLSHAVASQVRKNGRSASTFFELVSQDDFNRQISLLFSKEKNLGMKTPDIEEKNPISENEAEALLNALVGTALKAQATDIHIENSLVRFRICGELVKEIELDTERKKALVRRIKLLSHMNVVETRKGQDGQFVFKTRDSHDVFVRVSCVPSVGNEESLVLRLLDTRRMPLCLDKLGFDDEQLAMIRELCRYSDGLILVCGATGSGKSTTAGAMLQEIRRQSIETKKILSLEDPPEYVLEGVTQIQVHDDSELSFHEMLRRSFRQDPDVIFIGEIRDSQTARVALQAAMTGHLVIATLHTGTLSQAVLRMQDLGAEPALIASVLRAVIVQRLVQRKLYAQIRVLDQAKENSVHKGTVLKNGVLRINYQKKEVS